MAGGRKETVATDFFDKAEGYKDDTALDFLNSSSAVA